MKKRWILFLMVSLLLVCMLAPTTLASEESGQSSITALDDGQNPADPPKDPVDPPKDPVDPPKDPVDPPKDPVDPPKDPVDPPKEPVDPPKDPTEGVCKHVWVEVTVPSTCTEQGGTCKVCSLCESIVVTELAPLAAHTYDSPCDADCNVCGTVREAAHKFSAGWDYNSTKHWHPCTICGAKGDEGAHYPGPAATEEKDQICLTCGKVMTQKRAHTHEKESTWSSDETGHWHKCTGCDEKLDFNPHSFTGTCGTPCTDCGYTAEAEHAFEDTWKSNAAEHWKVCSLCGEEGQHEAHVFDENQVCTVCGSASAVAETNHVHEFSDTWRSDEESHWQVCDCGEESPKSHHAFKVSAPDENGTVTYTCNTCGFEKTETQELQEDSGFPVGIVFGILIVIIIGLVIALLAVLGVFKKEVKKGSL